MKKILVANWKQNFDSAQVEEWLAGFETLVSGFDDSLDVVICPPFPFVESVARFTEKYDWLHTGAQDVSEHEDGAHTGYVGGTQLKGLAKYCIVGHSERGESSEIVVKKLAECDRAGIIPIICFVDPEGLVELRKQGVKTDGAILLWEDPGNISADGVYSPKPSAEIAEGVAQIREKYDITEGLVYGGSINRQNAVELGNIPGLDGGVSGGASLSPEHFFEIIKGFAA